MAKLAAFLERLAEKAAAREAEERGGNALSGDAADGGPGASSSSLYAKRGYWDDRYAEGAIGAAADKGELSNEWFVGYDVLQGLISRHFSREEEVVILGCGLSLLGEDMCRDGYKRVTAVDYSPPAIERMRSLQEKAEAEQCRAEGASGVHPAGCARVDYRVMDVTDMADYSDGSADSLLDKATLDTLMNLDDGGRTGRRMVAEAARVLKPGGRLVCVSYGEPADRLPVFGLPGDAQPEAEAAAGGAAGGGDASGEGELAGGGAGGALPLPWRLLELGRVAKGKAAFHCYVFERRR